MSKQAQKTEPRRFVFTAPLVKIHQGGWVFALVIPAEVSAAITRRGPVPIVATLEKTVEIQASLVPTGGGRHRLRLNARTRGELEIEPGDTVRVALMIPEKAPVLPLPAELAEALGEAALLDVFSGLRPGKQNHIIQWIEEAVHPETRERRVQKAVEVALGAREHAYDRKNARKRKPRDGGSVLA